MMSIKNLTLAVAVAASANAARLNAQTGAQLETENFWDDIGDAFSDAGKWIGHAADDVGDAVVGATVALGTEKFWNSLGNTVVEATEEGLE